MDYSTRKFLRELTNSPRLEEHSNKTVTIVCGAPGSGKTSYVREHRKQGDLIIDMDMIVSALQGTVDAHPKL